MKYDWKYHEGLLKQVFRPGAVVLSVGVRGGGKTHAAVAITQEIIEGVYPSLPKKVTLITNIIFVRRVNESEEGFVTEAPPGVYSVYTMKELFPLVADILERDGRDDTLIILLLDEAQNFLQGEQAAKSTMNADMKKFTGIIRKFNMCLWLLTPISVNIGPAFRGFIDSDNPANVTAMFRKNIADNERFIKQRHYDLDPRALVNVQISAREKPQRILIPVTSWTRNPKTIAVGEYAYDNLSSADFTIGKGFDFSAFVTAISNGSSYELIPKIRQFYESMESSEEAPATVLPDPKAIQDAVRQREKRIALDLLHEGIKRPVVAKVIGVSVKSIGDWKAEAVKNGEVFEKASGRGRKGKGPADNEENEEGRKEEEGSSRDDIYFSTPPSGVKGPAGPASLPVSYDNDNESNNTIDILNNKGTPFQLSDGRYDMGTLLKLEEYYSHAGGSDGEK